MLITSRVDSGGEGRAVAAPLPQSMGNKFGTSPLSVARRALAFFAGGRAVPRLDGSIDGVARSLAGETALLTIAAALVLSTTRNASAADADVMLDEDRISYK